MFPTLSEAVTGERLTVAAPFFNKWMAPIGLDPAVPHRRRAAAGVAEVDAHEPPRLSSCGRCRAGVVTGVGVLALGHSRSGRRACASRCARSSTGTIVQEFWRGANVRRKNTGTDIFTALVGLVGRNKRRYGGYIVHVGIVLICLGFAGNGYKKDEQVAAEAGRGGDGRPLHAPQRRRQGHRRRPEADDDGVHRRVRERQADRHDVSGEVGLPQARTGADDRSRDPADARRGSVRRDGGAAADQAISRRAWRSSSTRWSTGSGSASASSRIGTGIALLPERAYSFAVAKLPVEAAATSTVALLLAFVLLGRHDARSRSRACRRHERATFRRRYYARNEFEKQLQHEIVCTCGTCGHATIGECRKDPCGTSHADARRARGADRQKQVARRDHPVVRHEVRRPGDARRADRQGLQPPGLAVPVPGRRDAARSRSASPRSAGRAAPTHAAEAPPPSTPRSTSASTMSSATSTRPPSRCALRRPSGTQLP